LEQILKIGTNFKNGINFELEQISKLEKNSKLENSENGTNYELKQISNLNNFELNKFKN
jgi:hypothetical protein